jgi:hypothetical protein
MKTYKPLLIIILVTFILYAISLYCSTVFLERIDREQYKKYLAGGIYQDPLRNGLPWEIHMLYRDVFRLAQDHNIILLGASSTVVGVIPELLHLPSCWRFSNLAARADNADGYPILLNYLNKYSNHVLNKTDIVVVAIELPSLANKPSDDIPMKQYLELFDFYTVNDDLTIYGSVSNFRKEWVLGNLKMRLSLATICIGRPDPQCGINYKTLKDIRRNILSLFQRKQKTHGDTTLPSNRVSIYGELVKQYMRNAKIPSRITEDFKNFLKKLHCQTNVVVVNIYGGSWSRTSQLGKDYQKWVEDDLKPYLEGEGISFIDLYKSIPDEEFLNTLHLSYKGRVHYTALLNKKLQGIFQLIE